MTASNKTVHFLHENITWKRLLDFFMLENSYLKNRLSEVVDKVTDKLLIADAEQFQNEFLQKDEGMYDIKKDIQLQEKSLQQSITQKEELSVDTCKKQEKLRSEIVSLERDCSMLKNKFNSYLLVMYNC